MNTIQSSRLLKFAFAADAVVSGAVAVLQLALTDALAALLELPHVLLLESGIVLVGYAALLAVLARRDSLPRALVLFLVIGNVGWALGCGLTIALTNPGALGVGFALVQAVTVLVFAGLQLAGLKASAPGEASARPRVA